MKPNESLDRAFAETVEPYRGALRAHCYRMLGSSHDGDDVVQETFLRAWRARETLEHQEKLRPWLYRIATNACLDALERRPQRSFPSNTHPPAADPLAPFAPPMDEAVWLEPMPDTWLASADTCAGTDPSARYALRESVALAFVAAIHVLSPPQRAVLLLRDVVGLSADETAHALGLTVSAANSALFRARTAVDEKLGGRDPASFAPAAEKIDQALLAQYVHAFEQGDVEELVAILHDEVETTMPPTPTWISGKASNEAFFRQMFASGMIDRSGFLRTGANGHPAFGYYRARTPGERRALQAIQVIRIRDRKLYRVDHFKTPAVFPVFGLPDSIDPAT